MHGPGNGGDGPLTDRIDAPETSRVSDPDRAFSHRDIAGGRADGYAAVDGIVVAPDAHRDRSPDECHGGRIHPIEPGTTVVGRTPRLANPQDPNIPPFHGDGHTVNACGKVEDILCRKVRVPVP